MNEYPHNLEAPQPKPTRSWLGQLGTWTWVDTADLLLEGVSCLIGLFLDLI